MTCDACHPQLLPVSPASPLASGPLPPLAAAAQIYLELSSALVMVTTRGMGKVEKERKLSYGREPRPLSFKPPLITGLPAQTAANGDGCVRFGPYGP